MESRTVAFYERRKEAKPVEVDDRRQIAERRNGAKPISPEQRRLASQIRRYEREAFKIPVRLRLRDKEISGFTHDISPEGLLVFSDTNLSPGTPMTLQFTFGENVCSLNISGQVLFCRTVMKEGSLKQAIGITFSAIRDFEQTILTSAVQELRKNAATQEKSLLSILVSPDTLTMEAAGLTAAATFKESKKKKKFTPHPPWILELDRYIEPYRKAILECSIVQEASTGALSLRQMRAWMIQMYPFIETFPKWIALNIAKDHDPVSRAFLIDNVSIEKKHAEHWIDMAQGFGIHPDELSTVEPLPEVDALTHWLWSINTRGTLAEGIGATNYAIEGITQHLSKFMLKGFPHYDGLDGVQLDKTSYWWAEEHASYDDLHPLEALEIIKLYATTKSLQDRVMFATRRSLEYLLMAAEACYTHFKS